MCNKIGIINILDDLRNYYNIQKKTELPDFCSCKASSSSYCDESVCSENEKVIRLSFEDWIDMKPEYAHESSRSILSPNSSKCMDLCDFKTNMRAT